MSLRCRRLTSPGTEICSPHSGVRLLKSGLSLPTTLSLFYACAIALDKQLVFVHRRTPSDDKQKWCLGVPPIVTLLIGTFSPGDQPHLLTDIL